MITELKKERISVMNDGSVETQSKLGVQTVLNSGYDVLYGDG